MESTVEERILLHLKNHLFDKASRTAPYFACQQGIADAVATSLSQVSRVARQMVTNGLLIEEMKYLKNEQERKRKVYGLSAKGMAKEKMVREKYSNTEIVVRTREGEKKVNIFELQNYVEDEDPLLYAMVHVDPDGVLDLVSRKKLKKKPFVDREDEFSKLIKFLERVAQEGCNALFVVGEVGMGKTTLCMELKGYAERLGFVFLTGGAHFGTSEPYLPLKKAFQRIIEEDKKAAEFYKSLISIGTQDFEKDIITDTSRTASFLKVTNEIKKIAHNTPMVIFLDDLQWADTATLLLLHYLINNLKDAPVLFICTYRPEDVSTTHQLNEISGRLSRLHKYNEIRIGPLELKHSRELLYDITGNSRLPSDFVGLIHRVTQGNPLFLTEFTELLIEEGKIPPDSPSYPTDESQLETPKIIEDVLQRRLDFHLSKEALKVVELASIIGNEIPFKLLHQISNKDELELLYIIDELLERGIWNEESKIEGFIFSHILMATVAYRGISSLKKKKVHIMVANKIRELYTDKIANYYSDIAYHYEKGGEYTSAVYYYIKAGEEAKRVFAHEDAIVVYKKALELTKDDEDRINILKKLGEIHATIDEYDEAMGYFEEIMNKCQDNTLRCKLLCEIGYIFLNRGQYGEAFEKIGEGLELCADNNLRCELLNKKGWGHLWTGDLKNARKTFEEEKETAEKIGDAKRIAQAIHDLGTLSSYEGKYDLARKLIEEALEIREDIKDFKGVSGSLNNLGLIYRRLGDLDKAIKCYERDLELAETYGHKKYVGVALRNIGRIYKDRGEFDRALTFYERSLEIVEGIGDISNICFSLQWIGEIYYERGDIERAKEYILRTMKLREEINEKSGLLQSLDCMAKIHLFENDLDSATEHYEKSLDIYGDVGGQMAMIKIQKGLAEVYLKKGKIDIGLEHAKKASELSISSGIKRWEGLIYRALGNLYDKQGAFEKARLYFEKGETILEGIGNVVDSAKIRCDHGIMLINHGEEDRGREHIKMAQNIFEDIGMKGWVKKAETALDHR